MDESVLNNTKLHYKYPNFERRIYDIPDYIEESIKKKLTCLYGKDSCAWIYEELERILQVHFAHKTEYLLDIEEDYNPANNFNERDVFLITYGDLIHDRNKKPLQALSEFSFKHLKGIVNTLHILPFFPYSSDRGFSVIDFKQVDPELGTWEDIMKLKSEFKLMFDCVFNHVSSKSKWFQEFLCRNKEYDNFFTVFTTTEGISEDHLELIIRPRTSDLFTHFKTLSGTVFVWTTFSKDQIDLNYKNPIVLLKIIEILLTYVRMGADILRLDAINYLWSELGTSCSHLKETHTIIKLFRDILDCVEPKVSIATETNVPLNENVKYFGNGKDEAQLIYNFTLPPLVLHTFLAGNSCKISDWASSLISPSNSATYLNILDTHDGVGLAGAKDILDESEIENIILSSVQNGGFISYRNSDRNKINPYELNISWFSALNNNDSNEPIDLQIKRFIASRSIALVLKGIPGVYLHSFLGTENDVDSVLEEKNRRSINRSILNKSKLDQTLCNPESTTYKIFNQLAKIIQIRTKEKSFHPNADQNIIDLGPSIFSLIRTSMEKTERILCITNVTDKVEKINLNLSKMGLQTYKFQELITNRNIQSTGEMLSLTVGAYEILWLKFMN